MIYKEVVYKCIDMMPEWGERVAGSDTGVKLHKDNGEASEEETDEMD